jgi:ferritin-like metal-binding protein YciE
MEKMHDLKDLLKHEILDLVSAEDQIIAALPAMIQKAGNTTLKEALQRHLQVTEQQRKRLDEVQQLLGEGEEATSNGEGGNGQKRGFIAGLFRKNKEEKQECLGTKGLIEEGEKVMAEPMEPEVLDAAIIGCAQKIEHYEICGYGTAKAYALELGLTQVAQLLEQTLNEEYEADDNLTALAVGRLNKEAENTNSNGAKNKQKSNAVKGSSVMTKSTGSSAKPASGNGNGAKTASKTAGAKGSTSNSGAITGFKSAGTTAGKASAKTTGGNGNKTTAVKSNNKPAAKKGSSAKGR